MNPGRIDTTVSRAGDSIPDEAGDTLPAGVVPFRRRTSRTPHREPYHRVTVRGRQLLVRRSGDGPPLLLLAGVGMPLTTWTPLVRRLPEYGCIEVGLPGSGGSIWGRPILSMSEFAGTASGLLDRLGIARADVLGLSFGGLVAQELAHAQPARVHRLILASTLCGLGALPVNPVSWWTAVLAGGAAISDGRGVKRHAPRGPRELLHRLGGAWSTLPRPDEWAAQVIAASTWSSLPWLAQLPQETLVITGTADTVVPQANASILAAKIPRARIHRVAGGGHMCLVERARETAPVVSAFLRSSHAAAGNEVI